jgi:regulatory protein
LLGKGGVDEDIADRVLSRLDEVGLINDAAFAEQWVHSRHTYQGLARRALAAELRRKGVADHETQKVIAELDGDTEQARARELVRKKLRTVASADDVTKVRRLVGMLARKGYPEGLAYRVVRDELKNAGDETSLLDDATPE